jgi:hypothetical protein
MSLSKSSAFDARVAQLLQQQDSELMHFRQTVLTQSKKGAAAGLRFASHERVQLMELQSLCELFDSKDCWPDSLRCENCGSPAAVICLRLFGPESETDQDSIAEWAKSDAVMASDEDLDCVHFWKSFVEAAVLQFEQYVLASEGELRRNFLVADSARCQSHG